MADQTSFTENSGPLELGPQALTHKMDRVAEGRRRKILRLKEDMVAKKTSPEGLALVDEAMGLLAIVNQYMKMQFLPDHIEWVAYSQREDDTYNWTVMDRSGEKTTTHLWWGGIRINKFNRNRPKEYGLSRYVHCGFSSDGTYDASAEVADPSFTSFDPPKEGIHTLVNCNHAE